MTVIRIRVAALVIRDNRILLARHLKGSRTTFLLPGGGMEREESAHEALIREIREEAGVHARIGELRYVVEARAPDASRHLLQLVFAASIDGEPGASTDARVVACEWHPFDALASIDLHPAIGGVLAADLRSGSSMCRYIVAPWAL